jgi:hypothetical protein
VELPEFDDLRFFAGVAAAGTLTEVARQWGVSVSAVSGSPAWNGAWACAWSTGPPGVSP